MKIRLNLHSSMSNVSKLAAMYGQPPPSSKPNLPGKPATGNKNWPPDKPVSGGSSFLYKKPAGNDDAQKDWRTGLPNRNKTRNEEKNDNSSVVNSEKPNDIPPWKQKLNANNTATKTEEKPAVNPIKPAINNKPSFVNSTLRSTNSDTPKPINSFINKSSTLPKENNTSWKPKPQPTNGSNRSALSSRIANFQGGLNESSPSLNPASDRNASSPRSPNGSIKSSGTWQSEKSSAGSDGKSDKGFPTLPPKPEPTSERENQAEEKTRSGRNQSSFLFRPSSAANQIATSDRRRRPLPPTINNQPPPAKPRKHFNITLPGKEISQHKGGNHSDLPPPLPPTDNRSPSGDSVNFKGRSPSFLNKQKDTTQKQPPVPPSSRPSIPTPLDDAFPRPPPVETLRNLPPIPPGAKGISSAAPPQHIEDDVYDETEVSPNPPLPARSVPPPLDKRISSGEIATWDDEDEVLYDETAEESSMNPPARPGAPHDLQAPEAINEEGDEMYEDLDQYSKFKGRPPTSGDIPNSKLTKEDEKKKKEAEKKEKEIRKKFKLPKEGEIEVQSQGIVKADSRAFGLGMGKDLTVHAQETLGIIRMVDNPKGKWLVRNKDGMYGYVDSDNIDVAVNTLRSTMHSAGNPPLPQPLPAGLPPPIPTEDENVYDETPEDLYEEL